MIIYDDEEGCVNKDKLKKNNHPNNNYYCCMHQKQPLWRTAAVFDGCTGAFAREAVRYLVWLTRAWIKRQHDRNDCAGPGQSPLPLKIWFRWKQACSNSGYFGAALDKLPFNDWSFKSPLPVCKVSSRSHDLQYFEMNRLLSKASAQSLRSLDFE